MDDQDLLESAALTDLEEADAPWLGEHNEPLEEGGLLDTGHIQELSAAVNVDGVGEPHEERTEQTGVDDAVAPSADSS